MYICILHKTNRFPLKSAQVIPRKLKCIFFRRLCRYISYFYLYMEADILQCIFRIYIAMYKSFVYCCCLLLKHFYQGFKANERRNISHYIWLKQVTIYTRYDTHVLRTN